MRNAPGCPFGQKWAHPPGSGLSIGLSPTVGGDQGVGVPARDYFAGVLREFHTVCAELGYRKPR
eukprot:10577721-Prorocentrum_lima.AAC.1